MVWLLFIIVSVSAQNQPDTSNRPFLAAMETRTGPTYIIKKSNVIFPDILKGNEAEMMPFIEKFCLKNREHVKKLYSSGKKYLPKAAIILKKYDLPEELKIMLALESGYNGNAVSQAGAVGYWQIMDEMAQDYGLKYTARPTAAEKKRLMLLRDSKEAVPAVIPAHQKDDRKNFYKATHAAARYLRDSRQTLDDNWLLIVASYNCGAGNMRKAIRKGGKSNPTFWDIKKYLPAETRNYVMNFITLSVIFNNYEMFASNTLSFADEKIMVPAEEDVIRTYASPQYADR